MAGKPTRVRYALFALFILYVLVLLFILVFPNNYRGHNVFVGGLTGEKWFDYVVRNVNLVPLRGIAEQISSMIAGQHLARNLIYLAGNIAGFVPLGFFLPALFPRQRKFLLFLITILISIVVLEFTQVATMRGSFDIDDVLLNTAGACFGFVVMRKPVQRIAP